MRERERIHLKRFRLTLSIQKVTPPPSPSGGLAEVKH